MLPAIRKYSMLVLSNNDNILKQRTLVERKYGTLVFTFFYNFVSGIPHDTINSNENATCSSMNTNPALTNKFPLAGGVKLHDPHNSQTTSLRALMHKANYKELSKTKSN